ncbi:MAG: hypothetical protein Q9205_005334 [Flavoplaca limonia]
MSFSRLASRSSSGFRDSGSHAYYSTVLSCPEAQSQGSVSNQWWRERNSVEDSQASDETYDAEQLPDGQTEVDTYLPQEIPDDHWEFASTRPIFDKHQLESQRGLDSTLPCVCSPSQEHQSQTTELFADPSRIWFLTQNEPESLQQPIDRSPSAETANFDSQEIQLSNTLYSDRHHTKRDPHETVETVPITQPIRLSERAASRLAFNTVGRLARDDSWITMDDGATQQATLPPTDPYAQNVTLNDFDRTDILCILMPTTPAACQAVEFVEESAPQHILRRPGKLSPMKATTPTDQTGNDVQTSPKAKPSMDIALRMNSKLLNPALGFTFGRNKKVSDLLISKDKQQVSQRHFRIYVNSKGSLMCQDTSTNGTVVDSVSLGPKRMLTDTGDQRTLHHGSVIELLLTHYGETMRFMVQVPDRSGVSLQYGSKLDQYIDFVEQMERRLQEENHQRTQGALIDINPAPIPQFSHSLRGDKLSTRANKVLVAGTEPFNCGMQWNGGDTYHVTALLGKGAFASVYKLTRRADGELFAAKEIRKTVFAQRGVLDRRVEQELNIMKQLEHPNIVQYIEHYETPEYLYILMELVPHGDLQSVLQASQVLTEYHCQAIASQMCGALKYLHDQDITHRDIKPDNILIQSNMPFVFKLSDFGLSKVVKNNETFLTSFCGTYLYCAPEVYPGYHHYNKNNNHNEKAEPRRRSTREGRSVTKGSHCGFQADISQAQQTKSQATIHNGSGHVEYRSGTTDNYGALILENIMNNPVDYSRLRKSGVSQDAVDFLNRMLIIEPSLRMSDVDCLEHPWLVPEKKTNESEDLEFLTQVAARNDNNSTRDTEQADDDFDFQKLTSQLSLKRDARALDSEDFEEPPSEDLEEIEEMIEGVEQVKQTSDGEEELDSFDEYVDHYPSASQIRRAQQATANNNHLFGQISPAALRSSGALGREARRALGMPSDARGELDVDESHYEGSSQFSATDYPNVPNQSAPSRGYHLDSGEAAPSLLGAEAMVDNLHMDSIMADVSEADRQAVTPNMEGANEQTSQPELGTSQSAKSDDYLYKATPPRSRRHLDEPSASMRESKRVKTQHEMADAHKTDSPMEAADVETTQMGNSGPSVPTEINGAGQDTTDTATGIPASEMSGQQVLTSTNPLQTASTPSSSTTKADSSHLPAATAAAPTTATLPNAVTTESNPVTTKPGSFAPPPPPGPITYGTLTPTSSSLTFKSIKLKQRVTTFGRHPACDYTWPNGLDTRVPKFALDIAFWRPRLERSLTKHPNLKWQVDKDLRTIIATRTSSAIFVNGVALTKKPDAEKGLRYGVLRAGDIVMVFDDKAKNEKLEFRVDIRIGKSKLKRKQDEAFEVVKEEQEDGKGVDVGSSHGSGLEGQAVEGAKDGDSQGNDKQSKDVAGPRPVPSTAVV